MSTVKTKKKLSINNVFILLLLIPIVDCITGYFSIQERDVYFNLLFRIITIIILFYVILKKNSKKTMAYMYILFMILFIDLILLYFKSNSMIELKENCFMLTKLLLPILYILGISNSLNQGYITYKTIKKVFEFYIVFIPLSLIIPYLLGVGTNIYNSGILKGIGYKGFYYAGNDLNVVLIIICVFEIVEFIKNKNIKNFIFLFMILIAIFLLGTKTSFIILLVTVIACIFKEINNKKIIKNIVVVVLVSVCIISFVNIFFNGFIDKYVQTYLRVYAENKNVFTFLFSGRNEKIIPFFNSYYEKNSLLSSILFGNGSSNFLIEMDYLDTALWFGWIIANILFFFYLIVFLKGKNKKIGFEYKLSYFVVFVYSLLGGHVWYSAFSGSIFGMLGGVILSNENEMDECKL